MFRTLFGSKPAGMTITPAELQEKLRQGEPLLLLDVRSAQEYRGDGHIDGARLIELSQLAQHIDELPRDQPVVCVCLSGSRSGSACELLRRHGFEQVINLRGGMLAWQIAGLPVTRGR